MRLISGIFSVIIWIAFLVIGIIQQKTVMIIISIIFVILSALMTYIKYRRVNSVKNMWKKFVSVNPDLKDELYESWTFYDNVEIKKTITERILSGEVCGESYSIEYFEKNGREIPVSGKYYVICDASSQACCVVRSIDVIRCTYNTVTPEIAAIEGYQTVNLWNKANRRKFENICDKLDIEFDTNMEIFFEKFEIVYKTASKKNHSHV